LLIDKTTKKIYYIRESLKVGERFQSVELNTDSEDDQDDQMFRYPSQDLDLLADLGWEGLIIAQLISGHDSKPAQTKRLTLQQENLLP
jgi:hypothetical protein